MPMRNAIRSDLCLIIGSQLRGNRNEAPFSYQPRASGLGKSGKRIRRSLKTQPRKLAENPLPLLAVAARRMAEYVSSPLFLGWLLSGKIRVTTQNEKSAIRYLEGTGKEQLMIASKMCS
ncbi:MAG: hypothetical protein ACI92G_002344 [Candidatus Pelagisphaera sp.]|jgi:hypothetical protein